MSPRQRVIHYCLTLKDCFVDIGIKNSAISATCCEEGNACGVQIHHISVTRLPRSYVSVKKWRGVELLRVNVHMCTETEMQNKWIKNKSEWGRGIKTICLGQCHVAIGASKRRQSVFFGGGGLQACALAQGFNWAEQWQRLKGAEMHGGGWRLRNLWAWGCGNKSFTSPAMFIAAFTREQVRGF